MEVETPTKATGADDGSMAVGAADGTTQAVGADDDAVGFPSKAIGADDGLTQAVGASAPVAVAAEYASSTNPALCSSSPKLPSAGLPRWRL